MRKGITLILLIAGLMVGVASAAGVKPDVFKGKLFAPNVILEHRVELDLSKQQFTKMKAIVLEVQTGVAEHEWDMQEAYQAVMKELNEAPIDESKVLKHAMAAMLAENQVKAKQMTMLVRLKNMLTPQQITYLEGLAER